MRTKPNPFTVLPHSSHVRAGQLLAERRVDDQDRRSKRNATAEGAVIHFLLNHPESTSDQVFKATGKSVLSNTRFLYQRKDKRGVTHWEVNRLKYRRYLRTGGS